MYHERQQRMHCLMHACNALLQRRQFTPADLDTAADAMGGLAQRSRLPFFGGNWDANTLLAALAPLGLDVLWHDLRDAELAGLDLGRPGLLGLLLNTRGGGAVAWAMGWRHWLALRRLGGAWWNLDSKLSAPRCFAGGGAPAAAADGGAAAAGCGAAADGGAAAAGGGGGGDAGAAAEGAASSVEAG
ncbi:MAG: hypothetical protein J3K34DRAFT_527033 [Monoraphidium minutum]|nr:MAG: hypothetical protein J3K34DRAFT_527033 [Monoraphidium minutum]